MQSKVKYMIDALLFLRTDVAAAVTSTGNSDAVVLTRENGLEGHPDALAAGQFTVIVDVTALDTSDADETYVLAVKASDNSSFGNEVTVGSLTVTGTGLRTFVVDSEEIDRLGTKPDRVRIGHTLGGTTPSITYTAWIAPLAGD